MPMAAEIHAICARYPAVVLKPHPQDRHHSLLEVAAAAPTRVIGVIDDNAYRMLSLPIRLAWRGAADAGAHAGLDDVVLTPDFWRVVLAPHVPVTAADGMRLRAKPNRLRIALDSFWNYHEIDTDRIPRSA